MTTIYKYRVYCTTDSTYEYTWDEDEPTTCPTNTAHSIDSTKTTIIETQEDGQVTIKEENTPTGGHFAASTITINAIKNTVSTKTICWPYNISVLSVTFTSSTINSDDIVEIIIGDKTVVGVLTGNVAPASAWTSQNYTNGQVVTYTHPYLGARVYTCILDTVSNENPLDATYWRHGLEINVSSTVIDNIEIGYFVNLFDGVNSDDVGRIIYKDIANSKIYVETNPTNSFSAASPTYVRQSVKMLQDYHLCQASTHIIGSSKIGASHIPTDTLITVSYDNKSTDTDKTFTGRVEFLY